jgi:hypothetical protein
MSVVGDELAPLTVYEEVELFQHSLADQDLVTKHECLVQRVASLQLDDQRLSDTHDVSPPVRVLGDPLPADGQPEARYDMGRQDDAYRSGIHESVRLVRPHLLGPDSERAYDEAAWVLALAGESSSVSGAEPLGSESRHGYNAVRGRFP